MNSDKIFLDQAATSYPKPEAVYQKVNNFAREVGIASSRGNYSETLEVAQLFKKTREGLAELINSSPENIIFSSSCTESMSTILLGGLEAGDRVLISPFEHNATLRPLQYLEANRGVEVEVLPGNLAEGVTAKSIQNAINSETSMCIINHISGAFGVKHDIEAIGSVLKENDIFFVVDAAQSIGTMPLDVKKAHISGLCFSGHKGLLGPTGSGGFYVSNKLNEKIIPRKMGGTGRDAGGRQFSDQLPYKYEVGSQNSWGIAGLAGGICHIQDRGVAKINKHIRKLTRYASKKLSKLKSLKLYLPERANHQGIISFTTSYLPPHDVASLLDEIFNIKVRAGLHCSPLAHKTVGTFPGGTVRISFGGMNDKTDIKKLSSALQQIEVENK